MLQSNQLIFQSFLVTIFTINIIIWITKPDIVILANFWKLCVFNVSSDKKILRHVVKIITFFLKNFMKFLIIILLDNLQSLF